MTISLRPGRLRRSPLAALPLLLGLAGVVTPQQTRAQQALFGALELEQQRFVLVAAPIGTSGNRYQLNIYEQVNDRRPCFAAGNTLPTPVNPLLATFDFTGICGRYIDANGYSLRVGGSDLATSYRLMVRADSSGTTLLALPTKSGAGPEMVVARSGGPISGFHKLHPEPGWRLMRRTYAGRRLGHLYVYSDSWPGSASAGGAASGSPGTLTGSPVPATTPATGSAPQSPAPSAVPTSGSPAAGNRTSAVPSTPVTAAPDSRATAPAGGNGAAGPAAAAMPQSGRPAMPPSPPPRL